MTRLKQVLLSEDDYDFISRYDPERERSASRRDLVSVIEEMQAIILDGAQPDD